MNKYICLGDVQIDSEGNLNPNYVQGANYIHDANKIASEMSKKYNCDIFVAETNKWLPWKMENPTHFIKFSNDLSFETKKASDNYNFEDSLGID